MLDSVTVLQIHNYQLLSGFRGRRANEEKCWLESGTFPPASSLTGYLKKG